MRVKDRREVTQPGRYQAPADAPKSPTWTAAENSEITADLSLIEPDVDRSDSTNALISC